MREAADGAAIKILLVDDHPIVREGYRRLLERLGGFRVVGEAGEAAAAYDVFRRTELDVTVMDISMPGASGLEAMRRIRQWDSRARILVCSMHCTAALALKAFEAGASGYVAKSADPDEFAEAIRVVARGGRALSADISRAIAEEAIAGGRSILDACPREKRTSCGKSLSDRRAKRLLRPSTSASRPSRTITIASTTKSERAQTRIWFGWPLARV
jgi:DNA-binding NarL/FixJ family response regulator